MGERRKHQTGTSVVAHISEAINSRTSRQHVQQQKNSVAISDAGAQIHYTSVGHGKDVHCTNQVQQKQSKSKQGRQK